MNKLATRTIVLIFMLPIIVFSDLGCGMGPNPPTAPFGSSVFMINPPVGISIPFDTQAIFEIRALVLSPDGFPLNDVRVEWSLSFANQNDLIFDSNGDGIGDAQIIQFVDPDACGPVDCISVDSALYAGLGAFVDSPFQQLTNSQGIATVIILISGDFVIDPATLQIISGTAIDVASFGVNN